MANFGLEVILVKDNIHWHLAESCDKLYAVWYKTCVNFQEIALEILLKPQTTLFIWKGEVSSLSVHL